MGDSSPWGAPSSESAGTGDMEGGVSLWDAHPSLRHSLDLATIHTTYDDYNICILRYDRKITVLFLYLKPLHMLLPLLMPTPPSRLCPGVASSYSLHEPLSHPSLC